MEEKKYEISESLLKATLTYLGGCQHSQVEGLIAAIRQCEPMIEMTIENPERPTA